MENGDVNKSLLEERIEPEKELKRFVPTLETEGKDFQMDDFGNFRIVVDTNKGKIMSDWALYQGITTIDTGTGLYIAVTDYFKGYLPTECVLKVTKLDEEEKVEKAGDDGFVKIKIVDKLTDDKILNKKEIEDMLNTVLKECEFDLKVEE